jgi:hypothetical protein
MKTKTLEMRVRELEAALRELVNTARPSFPKTPFRAALDNATRLLEE